MTKLKRPCVECNKYFKPESTQTRMCEKCWNRQKHRKRDKDKKQDHILSRGISSLSTYNHKSHKSFYKRPEIPDYSGTPCKSIITDNIHNVEKGKALTAPLSYLNKSCEFRRVWDKLGEPIRKEELKIKKKEYRKKYREMNKYRINKYKREWRYKRRWLKKKKGEKR